MLIFVGCMCEFNFFCVYMYLLSLVYWLSGFEFRFYKCLLNFIK